MRGLEAAQELVEGVQHLLGQALADLVLELAAVFQQSGEALRARQGEEARLAEKQAHRGRDRPARGLDHVRDAEVEPTRAFAARRGDEPKRAAIEQKTRRHAGLAQEPLHPAVSRRLELAVPAGQPDQSPRRDRGLAREAARTDAPSFGSSSRTAKSGRSVSPYSGSGTSSSVGIGHSGVPAYPFGEKAPTEDRSREAAEIGQAGDRTFFRVERALFNARTQEPLAFAVAPVEDRPRANERRRGHDETDRSNEAEPFEMRDNFGVELGAGHQFVSGQR